MTRRLLAGFLLGLTLGCAPGPRPPALLYLSPLDAPEIWRANLVGLDDLDGGRTARLTHTGGQVYDFGPWPDGSRVVYAAFNPLGGTDLWLIPSGGGNARRLLECGGDRCANAAVSPDGKTVLYTRRNASENPAGEPGLPRPWRIDPATGATAPLYRDARISCDLPAWSPDGLRLSCYDPAAGGIRVHALAAAGGEDDWVFPTAVAHSGSWTPDSQALVFTTVDFAAEVPVSRIFHGDVRSGETVDLLPELQAIDMSPPVLSPDGLWLAVSLLLPGGASGRDLWLISLAGPAGFAGDHLGAAQPLEEDARISTTACRWSPVSPTGLSLACQESAPGEAGSRPAVVVWDVAARTRSILAQDAALPAWLP